MGTTVTTNLGLIKPDSDESIQEDLPTFDGWASQNADNCDTIDALFRKTTHTGVSTWTADTTNPVLGTGGFVESKYMRIYPRMVAVFFRIYAGSASFTAGSGIYIVSAPINIDPGLLYTGAVPIETPVGKAYFHDDSTAVTSTAFVVMYRHSDNSFLFRRSDGEWWRSGTPVAVANNDRLNGYAIYPTAVP